MSGKTAKAIRKAAIEKAKENPSKIPSEWVKEIKKVFKDRKQGKIR